jgi:predicted N-acetyltransferase YhbS
LQATLDNIEGLIAMDIIIRNETPADYRAVENLTRESFWNVYKPGADEHYFVHMMRTHPDFLPELAFVLEKDGEIIGNIMYTKAWLEDENGERKEILSFGPLCVAPEFQRRKLGRLLIEHSFDAARIMGYDANIHPYIDVTAPVGSVVKATLDGTVIFAGWSEDAGNTIQIQHESDIVSIYKHNEKLLKKVGEKVTAGSPIALIGNTGDNTTGTHLHFELWHKGETVDPTLYIKF